MGRELFRYMFRRVALAIPTLFGITLVCFALIHLAPGAVSVGTGVEGLRVSSSEARRLRRHFFLDLPLFFNGNPRGLLARQQRLCRQLQRRGSGAKGRIVRCGTACLGALVSREGCYGSLSAVERGELLRRIKAAHPRLAPGESDLNRWSQVARRLVSTDSIRALAATLGRSSDAEQALIDRGEAALGATMDVLLDGEGSGRVSAASRVASAITGMEGVLGPGGDNIAAIDRWQAWWWIHRRDYVVFDASDRWWGYLAETRYGKWLSRLLRFDFGHSLHDGQAVSQKIARALPVTLALSALAIALAYFFAIPLGVYGAVRVGTRGDRFLTATSFLLYAIPPFWAALLLIWLLSGGVLDVLPAHGLSSMDSGSGGIAWLWDRVSHLVLPIFCLTYSTMAVLTRYQRGAMLEVLQADFVRAARARGVVEWRVLLHHAWRNALLPMVTLLGLLFPFLVGGSVIVERIFGIPGMGLLAFESFLRRDYPVIMAVMVLSAMMTLLGLIVADLLCGLADPRVRVGLASDESPGGPP